MTTLVAPEGMPELQLPAVFQVLSVAPVNVVCAKLVPEINNAPINNIIATILRGVFITIFMINEEILLTGKKNPATAVRNCVCFCFRYVKGLCRRLVMQGHVY